MKVTLPKDYRKTFTLEDMDIARRIIRDMKEDDTTPTWYAEVALGHWIFKRLKNRDGVYEVLRATAEISKNRRSWEAYGEDTRQMDIWIEAVAKTFDGYLELGAYLTDINGIAPNTDFTDHMYARYYTVNKDV